MSARTTTEVATKATKAIGDAGKAKRTGQPRKPSPTKLPIGRNRGPGHEHGQQIHVYHHLQKNMIVYSLTKALRNNAALSQIPFNGKKTVPSALRKDLWHPFAQLTFPPGLGFVGLSVFQKLREYRRRHELEEKLSLPPHTPEESSESQVGVTKDPKAERKRNEKKARVARGLKLMDQKANSVADIAAVLENLREKEMVVPEVVNGRRVRLPSIGLKREGKGIKVEVLWRDLTDAEYAETWSDNVEHGVLPMHTNHRDPNRVWGLRKLLGDNNPRNVVVEEVIQEVIPDPETQVETQPEKVVL